MSDSTQQTAQSTDRFAVFGEFEDFAAQSEGWSTAKKIRHLRSLQSKEDRGAIAKYLGIKYQWVRNVLLQDAAKNAS